ncbi:hypothetical protein BHM03_00031764 [Ensete ventricosum]|nr:hypothetical protein BHM03_00031764 [Ensete ventricosum]
MVNSKTKDRLGFLDRIKPTSQRSLLPGVSLLVAYRHAPDRILPPPPPPHLELGDATVTRGPVRDCVNFSWFIVIQNPTHSVVTEERKGGVLPLFSVGSNFVAEETRGEMDMSEGQACERGRVGSSSRGVSRVTRPRPVAAGYKVAGRRSTTTRQLGVLALSGCKPLSPAVLYFTRPQAARTLYGIHTFPSLFKG